MLFRYLLINRLRVRSPWGRKLVSLLTTPTYLVSVCVYVCVCVSNSVLLARTRALLPRTVRAALTKSTVISRDTLNFI